MTKPTKPSVHPAKTGQAGQKVSSCGQQRLIRLGECPGWSKCSLGVHAQANLLVLSCCGSSVIVAESLVFPTSGQSVRSW